MGGELQGLGLVEELNGKYIFTSAEMKVEVGDTKQTSFYPQTKVMKWDNEVNFSLRYTSDIVDATVSKDVNDIITWIGKDNVKVRMYETTDPNDSSADGFEFEFELPEKPSTNRFDMTIQTKGLDFFYQDEITDKEAQGWIDRATEASKVYPDAHIYIPASLNEAKRGMRPENVVGSYAVYHSTKSNNLYKTGKAFHIYRPKAKDKEGTEIWCDMNIDTNTGILSITIPQEYLDKAAYPVIVDPTLGYTNAGGSSVGVYNNGATSWQTVSYKATATENGTVDSMTCCMDADSASDKMVLYDATSGLPATIVTNGASPLFSPSGTKAWNTVNYTSKPSIVSGTSYYLVILCNSFGTTIYYDTGTETDADNDVGSFTTPTTLRDNNRGYTGLTSIYLTYTSSAPVVTAVKPKTNTILII